MRKENYRHANGHFLSSGRGIGLFKIDMRIAAIVTRDIVIS